MKKSDLPAAIKRALEELEHRLGRRLSVLKQHKGRYYVYSYMNAKDRNTGASRSLTSYVGTLTQEGEFAPPKRKEALVVSDSGNIGKEVKRTVKTLQEKYKSMAVVPVGNKLYLYNTEFPEEPHFIGMVEKDGTFLEHAYPAKGQNRLGEVDSGILRSLSMNSRLSIKRMADIAHTNTYTARSRKAALEKKFGIRYLAEVDLEELGYNQYICFIRFEGAIPGTETLRGALSKEPRIQMAALVKGKYDLIMYWVAKDNNDITMATYQLRQGPLKDYKAEWYISPYNNYYGYIPMRDEFFDMVEKDKVWYREKDEPRKPKGKMTYSEYVTLRELNTNGDSDFTEIAERFRLKPYNVQYAYRALKEKYKFIERMTLTMHSIPARYNAVFIMKIADMAAFQDTRKELMLNVIEERTPINKYILEGDISVPDGVIFIAPILSDNDLENLKVSLLNNVKGIEIEEMIMTDVIVGRLCYRLFDNMYSTQYKPLVERYKVKTYRKRVIYDKDLSEKENEEIVP